MELSPTEEVFRIDHILEQIFDELANSPVSKNALLNCRLVSHRWLSFATKPLEKLVYLRFFNNKLTSMGGRLTSNCLNSLTQLLRQPNTFPAIKFSFFLNFLNIKEIPSDEIFAGFLPIYGINITQLHLIYFPFCPHESVIMEQVETLLSLTPNLLELTLDAPSPVSWENGGEGRSRLSELLPSDPEFHQILQRCSTKTRNTSLKFVNLTDASAKVFETIYQMSPNIEKVSTRVSMKVYFLGPVTRVHLIRDLFICPILPEVEIWERFALAYEGTTRRPQLEHLNMWLTDGIYTPEKLGRTVSAVSRVLNICSFSLKTISWIGLKILHRQGNGIKWPKLLPHLWKLELYYPQTDLIGERRYGLFPPQTNLAAMCPKLRFVAFDFLSICTGPNIGKKIYVESLMNALKFDPVESVQTMEIKNISDPTVLSHALKCLSTLFPNAHVNVNGQRRSNGPGFEVFEYSGIGLQIESNVSFCLTVALTLEKKGVTTITSFRRSV